MNELEAREKLLPKLTEEQRIKSSLYYFATEYLGYDKLSKSFHGPMLAEWDRIDRARHKGNLIDTLDLWPRDHIKTWCERARVIRYYLYDPTATITVWHSVEEISQESAVAIGKTLRTNLKLRKVFQDGVLPSPHAKRFEGASGFSLRSNRIGDAPSFRAWGAGSEATGGHSKIGWLDDPTGMNDVMDNQHATKKKWFQGTVCNVVKSGGWKDVTATRWDREDMYGPLVKSPYWKTTLRACMETNGVPDYKGEPVYLSAREIAKKRDQLGPVMFALQMMNDISHSEERPWKPESCEHFITREEAEVGRGYLVLIMDPAAAHVGGEDHLAERKRGDGSKDRWAIQLWKVRANGMRQERIWLDGESSEDWSMDEGMAIACRMLRRWRCAHTAIEDSQPYHYMNAFCRIARSEGVKAPARFNPDAKSGSLLLLQSRLGGKNPRWAAFCGRADSGEILICKDTVPDDQIERMLDQARNWVPRGKANGLPFDDEADCASYVMDPVIDLNAPKGATEMGGAEEWSPFRKPRTEEEFTHSTGHIRW